MPATATRKTIFTVSRLNQDVAAHITKSFGTLWVEGELSNFSRPSSGHWYFSLKDSRAQIRCAMFKGRNRLVDFQPEEGQQVLLRGKPGLYEPRGDFQFIAEHMELSGHGALQRQFEQTRQKLQEMGWFDPDTKLSLPAWPDRIGIITSPTGAALRDILQVIARRAPGVEIIIYPTAVQGEQAIPGVVRQLTTANQRAEADVLILARGGGSLEDLWAFNDERVAAAIRQSALPIVTGVGHEIDFTIADMVADLRAPTPSAAAELAVPDQSIAQSHLLSLGGRLTRAAVRYQQQSGQKLQHLVSRLHYRHPGRLAEQRTQYVDELEKRLGVVLENQIYRSRLSVKNLANLLQRLSPQQTVANNTSAVQSLNSRLHIQMSHLLERYNSQLANSARALDAVSPLATLDRGYAIVTHNNKVLSSTENLDKGDHIEARLANGTVKAIVERLNPTNSK